MTARPPAASLAAAAALASALALAAGGLAPRAAAAGEATAVNDVGPVRLRLPPPFTRLAPELFERSVALVPLLDGGAGRAVLAVFREGRGEDSATVVVARVARPLELGPTLRANAASAVASHFRAELSLEVAVDRAALAGPPGPARLEVRAEAQLDLTPRVVRFAFVPGGDDAHYVLAASYPLRREQELTPVLRAAFESFELLREDVHRPRPPFVRVAAFGLLGVAAVVALRLWRRSTRARDVPPRAA